MPGKKKPAKGKTAKKKPPAAKKRSSAKKEPSPKKTKPREGKAADSEAAGKPKEEERGGAKRVRFPIVGIGASAGGLEALQGFFSRVGADTGIAFIVVTHLHPGHTSMLPELLAKETAMPVHEAEDGQPIEPNNVYVAAPGGPIGIDDGHITRIDLDKEETPVLAVDHLFRSLARDCREHAIGIVLSGTGSDGTLGVRAVKAESGMAMVQKPESAKYAGMPSSAISTGLVDYVLPVEEMPQQLENYVRGPYLQPRERAAAEAGYLYETL